MAIPTTSWDEDVPSGDSSINAGDNKIREFKTQTREVIDVDHNFPSSGSSSTTGFHNQVTLIEAADIGTGSSGLPILGAQTIDTHPELVYTDEDDNDVQMTVKGTPIAINGCVAKSTPVAADLLMLSDSADSYKSKKLLLSSLLDVVYPVGSVYTNYSNSANPSTLIGIGTWVAIAGRVVVGLDASQTEFDTAGETGGTKTHVLTIAELPGNGVSGVLSMNPASLSTAAEPGTPGSLGGHVASGATVGSGNAHNNLQPYIVCYVWRRSA